MGAAHPPHAGKDATMQNDWQIEPLIISIRRVCDALVKQTHALEIALSPHSVRLLVGEELDNVRAKIDALLCPSEPKPGLKPGQKCSGCEVDMSVLCTECQELEADEEHVIFHRSKKSPFIITCL